MSVDINKIGVTVVDKEDQTVNRPAFTLGPDLNNAVKACGDRETMESDSRLGGERDGKLTGATFWNSKDDDEVIEPHHLV